MLSEEARQLVNKAFSAGAELNRLSHLISQLGLEGQELAAIHAYRDEVPEDLLVKVAENYIEAYRHVMAQIDYMADPEVKSLRADTEKPKAE